MKVDAEFNFDGDDEKETIFLLSPKPNDVNRVNEIVESVCDSYQGTHSLVLAIQIREAAAEEGYSVDLNELRRIAKIKLAERQ